MATATKSRVKTKKPDPVVEEHAEESGHPETDLDVKPGKAKKPIEIDEPEVAVAIDEKVEDDPLVGAVEEDDTAEEISLDGEEINPFGDRWEE
jgi:hypothetical protein